MLSLSHQIKGGLKMVKMNKRALWSIVVLALSFGFSTVSAYVAPKQHEPVVGKQKQTVERTEKEDSFLNNHLLKQAAQGILPDIPFCIGNTYKKVKDGLVRQGNSEFSPAGNKYVGLGPKGAYTHGFFKLTLDKEKNKQLWFETNDIEDTDTVRIIHIRKWNITKDMIIKALGEPTYKSKVVDDAPETWVFEYERGGNVLTFSHRDGQESVEVSLERNFDC